MAINFFAMGAMSQEALAASKAPIADIFAQYFGKGMISFITVSVVISVLGTTVGWLLSTARVAFAAGEDNMFPEVFAKVHPKYKTPYMALIIGSVLVNVLLLMNFNKTFKEAFDFIILLATLSFLPIYAMTAAADIKLIAIGDKNKSVMQCIKASIVPVI
jgi:amino acid transporter